MSLQMKFNLIAKKKDLWLKNEKILVAVSTGVDSMTLLTLLQNLPKTLMPDINVAYVDHHLRSSSKYETDYIKKYCRKKNLKLWISDWNVKDHPKFGIEAAAREYRYNFFKKVMIKNKILKLLTAHHSDDQIETILMQLIRSGNIDQMKGILLKQSFYNIGYLERPLLFFDKNQILSFAKENNIKFFNDETNFEDKTLRNRLRHHIVPNLKDENKKFKEHVQYFSENLSSLIVFTDKKLESLVNEISFYNSKENILYGYLNKILKNDYYIQYRIIQILWKKINGFDNLSNYLIDEIIHLINNKYKPNGQLYLPNNYFFEKSYDKFKFLMKKSNNLKKINIKLKLNNKIKVNDKFSINLSKNFCDNGDEYYPLNINNVNNLYLRNKNNDDFIYINNNQKQKINRFFINNHFSSSQRESSLFLVDDNSRVFFIFSDNKFYNFSHDYLNNVLYLHLMLN